MNSTELYCTNCGDEFGPDDDVFLKSTGFVSRRGLGRYIVLPSDDSYIEQLCESCNALLAEPRPNRVVVEIEGKIVQLIRAERPEELLVIVHDRELGRLYNRQHTVQKLNTVPVSESGTCLTCGELVPEGCCTCGPRRKLK